jgi:hypothetical protein
MPQPSDVAALPSDEKPDKSRLSDEPDDPDDVAGGYAGAGRLFWICSMSALLAPRVASATCSPDHAAGGVGGKVADGGDLVGQRLQPGHGTCQRTASDSA